MTRVKGIKNPSIMKETLGKIQNVLNDWEEWEIENGDAYGYVLKLNKNKDIELRIYDEVECESCNYSVAIPNENITSIKDIIKGFINEIYDKEINWRNSYLKANKGWYSRKHKSTNLWLERGNEAKVLEIAKDIAERYSTTKSVERHVAHYKHFISRLYYTLNTLDSEWRLMDIRDKALDRCKELNISNVGISYIGDTIICMRSNDKASKVIDKFEIPIERDYCNIPATVNQIIGRLRKVA